MINLKAHKILKILYKYFNDGEKKSKGGTNVTEKGRSFTTIELNEKTNYSINLINDICITLEQNEFIKQIDSNKEFKVYQYCITPKGMDAVITKHYVYSLLEFVVKWIPIAISVLSLCIAGIVAWYTTHNTQLIQKLQQEVSDLQKQVKTMEISQKKTN